MNKQQVLATAQLVLELLTLKNAPRTGWTRVGVPLASLETVAAHSYGSMIIAVILAFLEKREAGRSAVLSAIHDAGETRTSDITPLLSRILEQHGLSRDEIDRTAEEEQREGLPRNMRNFLGDVLEEFRAAETPDAQIAQDAQLIDRGLQALLYQRQGYPTQSWVEEILPKLYTGSGKILWQTILDSPDIFTAWFQRRN